MNTAHEATMPMPAEFCSPDDAQDVDALGESALDELGAWIETLQVTRYQAAAAYTRAMGCLRMAKGIPSLELKYRQCRDAALHDVRWASARLAKLQS